MREASTEESAAVCQEAGRLPFTGHVIQYFPLFDNDAALNSKKKDTLCVCVCVCVSVFFYHFFVSIIFSLTGPSRGFPIFTPTPLL